MIREPIFKNVELYSILSDITKNRENGDGIHYSLDDSLKNIKIKIDYKQIKIAFRNIFDNSIDAIEKAKNAREELGISDCYQGKITIKLIEDHPSFLKIELTDNGIGIPSDQQKLIYRKPFTTKEASPKKHGKGCINIINQMNKNQATISIDMDRTIYEGRNNGTVQIVTFRKAE
jgi:nitrogen fixation/metabolism regulation signal transduction histidine kinase